MLADVAPGPPEPSPSEAASAPRSRVGAFVLVLALVAVAHGGTLWNDFVAFDDDLYVFDNELVQGGLSPGSVRAAFALDAPQTYFHPLTWLSLAMVRQLFGPGPLGFHLANLVLHAMTALAMMLFLSRSTGRPLASTLASCLFAVHPLTVEAVAWAAEHKTVLSTALGMLAILAYEVHARRPVWWRLVPVGILLALSLLAKPGLVVLPGLLLVLDVWPLRRIAALGGAIATGGSARAVAYPKLGWGALLLEKLPLMAVSLGGAVLALTSVSRIAALRPAMGVRIANALAALPSYFSAIFWPLELGPYHLYRVVVRVGPTAAGALMLVTLLLLAAVAARRGSAIFLGIAWFLIALLPYTGLAQNGMWPAWADRFAYVPLMGVAIAVTFGADELAKRSRHLARAWVGLAAATVVALAIATRSQVAVWRDSVTLFQRAVEVEPAATLMRVNLGAALVTAGRHSEAVEAMKQAMIVSPLNARGHAILGLARSALGQDRKAEASFQVALRLDPAEVEALRGMGDLLARAGDPRRAAAYYGRMGEVSARSSDREYAARRLSELGAPPASGGPPGAR